MEGWEEYKVYITAIVTGLGIWLGLVVVRVLHSVLVKPRLQERCLRKQGINGSPYQILGGDGTEMVLLAQQAMASISKTPTHDILPRLDPIVFKRMKQHGNMFYIWFGTIARVVLLDPKLIKEMLTNKSGDFHKQKINAFTRLFVAGVSSLNGDKWAMHRKIMNPAFHMEKLKGMLPSFSICIQGLISRWEGVLRTNESYEFDVSSEFQKLTADIISQVAFGSSYEEGSGVFQLLNEQGKLFNKVYYMTSYPWLRHLPTKTNLRMKEINKEVKARLGGIVAKRMRAMEDGSSVKDDLLGLLLESNLKEQQGNKKGSAMTLDEVIEECKLFYFAGHETTATLLTWTIIALCMHPEWQEKTRKEVFTLLGPDGKPTFDDLSRLKLVTMVLQESLRLYPPSSMMRITGPKGAKLGDKHLPGGIQVVVPTPFIHRNQQLWGSDVLEFNPERYAEGISKAVGKDQAPYFPFGWGPRICIGQNLAMLEAKMALSMLLQHFSFELSPSYAHVPKVILTLQALRGAPVIVRRLRP